MYINENVSYEKIIFIFFSLFVIILFYNQKRIKNSLYINNKEKIYFDKYEVDIFNKIKEKYRKSGCSEMWSNQREFLNGIIRKYKPKKILEIGVRFGGSSIIILNAINDYKDSKLFSIDISSSEDIGKCVYHHFPEFIKKWNLFKGNIATEFMKSIGDNIDMLFIDTAHFEPGEILDFLIALPFLKENAIVIFHDIANQITRASKRNEWAPYIIFNAVRGEKFLPSGNNILTHDIGAVKLENNQKKYYHDYFRLLGGQWQYFPKEIHINEIINFFKEYYDNDCLTMFNETIRFNRNFTKQNPKNTLYKENVD
jgi:predicted O-methyltransferase YrrM